MGGGTGGAQNYTEFSPMLKIRRARDAPEYRISATQEIAPQNAKYSENQPNHTYQAAMATARFQSMYNAVSKSISNKTNPRHARNICGG